MDFAIFQFGLININQFSQIKFEAHIELSKSLEMNDTNKYEWMLLQAKECETIS
jgi:hypothetical protein